MNPKVKQERLAKEAKAALALVERDAKRVARAQAAAAKRARPSSRLVAKPQGAALVPPAAAPSVANPAVRAASAPVAVNAPAGASTRPAVRVVEKLRSLFRRQGHAPTEADRRAEAEHQRLLIAKDVKHAPPVAQPAKNPEPEPALKRRAKPVRRRRSFKELFKLAGIEEEPMVRLRKLVALSFWITLGLTGLAVVMGSFYGETFKDTAEIGRFLGFTVALWTVGFVAIVLLCIIGYLVWIDVLITRRRQEIEAVFPDYLQLAAANLSAGMTIDRALWMAVRPRFGVLAKEMEDVAKKTMTGYDLERSLKEFSGKYDSIVIKRAIDLICEGSRSGGRMAEILNKIATNIQENNILQKEMAANVTTYVNFISFASVLASPFLFALSTQLLVVIQQIAGSISVSQGSSSTVGLQLSADAVKLADFKIFSYVALSVTSIMSACIVSVIRKGTIFDGLRLAPMYAFVSLCLYWFASWALSFLFGGFLALS